MDTTILAPAAVLVLWSLVVLSWMAGTRLPGMAKTGIDLKTAPPGGRGVDLEPVLPAKTNWVSHNHTHLMEQPTLFYAVVAILALVGASGGVNTMLAWVYVAIRIVHSLWQILVNTIPVRFALFAASSLVLGALAVSAVLATI